MKGIKSLLLSIEALIITICWELFCIITIIIMPIMDLAWIISKKYKNFHYTKILINIFKENNKELFNIIIGK